MGPFTRTTRQILLDGYYFGSDKNWRKGAGPVDGVPEYLSST
jgi:hypothetical protein